MEVSSFAEALRVAARLLHIGFRRIPGPFLVLCVLPAKAEFLKVDPIRLELVTSAMRRQHEEFATVRLRSEIPANKHIIPKLLSPVFAIVRLGWCQVGVNWGESAPTSRTLASTYISLEFTKK
jgi:hypothetical protein